MKSAKRRLRGGSLRANFVYFGLQGPKLRQFGAATGAGLQVLLAPAHLQRRGTAVEGQRSAIDGSLSRRSSNNCYDGDARMKAAQSCQEFLTRTGLSSV